MKITQNEFRRFFYAVMPEYANRVYNEGQEDKLFNTVVDHIKNGSPQAKELFEIED